MRRLKLLIIALFFSAIALPAQAKEEIYKTADQFLAEAFDGDVPKTKVLWLKRDVKALSKEILDHAYPALRIRYWMRDDQSVWILEEIGKERPITMGMVVKGDEIRYSEILAYRESRGWEVRYPQFMAQYAGATLTEEKKLDRHIDGITGATLSVQAVTRIARLALVFHRHVMPNTTLAESKVSGDSNG
ncbi:FMN-binding protein [Corallincola spongiicola]|uniref:FMN-binding protein n=1 Tax=Corallincola spongiicola TaxID=2520508 RepID=A0ABY1WL24_9GAMM|nr:FMN-binding protein [Corallincola spongiicola]TAA41043.1 FMN-binding protein [Corallincola spongiicola]